MGEKEGEENKELEETSKDAASKSVTDEKSKGGNPVRTLTIGVLLLSIIIFIVYVLSDRRTPYTDQARIKGLSIPIVSRVAGHITDIKVHLHSSMNIEDTIFQLDMRPFELAIRNAEARLQNTQQQIGAKTATVKSAAGRLGVAKAQLDRAQRNYDRVMNVLEQNPGALSLADRDAAETSLTGAVEQVASAEADLSWKSRCSLLNYLRVCHPNC